jgi:catechol 2,3-dioxygenase-like lactoylglutathione lyase family enzyme
VPDQPAPTADLGPARPTRGTRIAHIGIAVRALDELRPFYRDVLGMAEVPLDDADGARIAGLAAGESLVELLEAAEPDSPDRQVRRQAGAGHPPRVLRRGRPRRNARAV